MASEHNKVMFLFFCVHFRAVMSLSGVRDVVGTPRERILNMSSSLRRCQAFGEKRKEGGGGNSPS